MIRIIGFEGVLGGAVISYGAAAVELHDGTIINSFTRHKQARSEIDASEALTFFKTSWEFDDDSLADENLVIVAVKREDVPAYVADLYPDTGRLGGYLKSKREKPNQFFLLRSRDAFRSYAEETAAQCADAVMREAWKGADALGLIRCALTLSPRNPTLLALRVFLSPYQPMVRRTAERLLEGTDDIARATYRSLLVACERSAVASTLYLVKYEDGDQKLGGFNLDDAVKQLHAIDSLNDRLEPSIRRTLPFLPEGDSLPKNRFQHFKAASAEIGFGVLGNNLRERVLRYLELDALAKLLRGEIPPDLAQDAAFVADLKKVISPAGGATLKHWPIGADELEPVAVEIPEQDERLIDEKQFRVLGFVQGFYREVKRAEIRLSTSHVESVSIADDGAGLTPEGAEMLRSGSGLFLPALFALLRRRLSSGRLRWFLQRMTLLTEAPKTIDTFGSTIVSKGLFSPATEVAATFDGIHVRAGNSQIRIHGHSIESGRAWMEAWQQDTREVELLAAAQPMSGWTPPPGLSEGSGVTAAMRVVLTLGPAPSGATIDQIVQGINDRFNTHVRQNNTWRTIRQNADLFQEGDDDVQLTPLGARWYLVLKKYFDAMSTRP
jgi:hypothetical protein